MTALLTFPFDYVAQCFVSVCLAVLFVQSGVDKVVDRSGNLDFHREHFAKSPLAGLVPLLLTTLTALELLSGALCSVGFVVVASGGSTLVAAYGASLCAATFVALFGGQRLAKDYAGAAALVPYMSFCVLSLIVLSPRAD